MYYVVRLLEVNKWIHIKCSAHGWHVNKCSVHVSLFKTEKEINRKGLG